MRRIFLLTIAIIFFQACDVFKSKDELLTEKKWVLHDRFYTYYENGESSIEGEYYKKDEAIVTLDFKSNGTVTITEKEGAKYLTMKWYWKSDRKKYITLEKGRRYGDFYVHEINGSEFRWTRSNDYQWDKNEALSMETVIETFWHLDNSEWDDKKIDALNMLK